MRIGCLQFAPQVGDVENNLVRAEAVLSKVNQPDMDQLDLLVLPEMAFSGYNFKSLQHIMPCLEHKGSGISSLWARTLALKHDCIIAVGYPEKVDVSLRWPASPEYYNSLILVGGNGDTIANYRKKHLHLSEESWALESQEGFFVDDDENLGSVAVAIGMDINPYRFEAPWHAFEFAFHVLEVEANLVVVSMAWRTEENSSTFTRIREDPDMESITYWCDRLEPLIRAELDEETIVVFCNRVGIEDNFVYSGSSTVLGICRGEVSVYGILGRGVKELLMVDTEKAPFAKLIHRPGDIDREDAVREIRSPVANTSNNGPGSATKCPGFSTEPAIEEEHDEEVQDGRSDAQRVLSDTQEPHTMAETSDQDHWEQRPWFCEQDMRDEPGYYCHCSDGDRDEDGVPHFSLHPSLVARPSRIHETGDETPCPSNTSLAADFSASRPDLWTPTLSDSLEKPESRLPKSSHTRYQAPQTAAMHSPNKPTWPASATIDTKMDFWPNLSKPMPGKPPGQMQKPQRRLEVEAVAGMRFKSSIVDQQPVPMTANEPPQRLVNFAAPELSVDPIETRSNSSPGPKDMDWAEEWYRAKMETSVPLVASPSVFQTSFPRHVLTLPSRLASDDEGPRHGRSLDEAMAESRRISRLQYMGRSRGRNESLSDK